MITQQELQADRDFAEKLDFKGVKFPVKIWGIHKIEKRLPSALVFLAMKIKKNNDSVYKKKQKNVDLLLIQEGKRHSVIIKDFNTFMYVHIFHQGKKHFCYY